MTATANLTLPYFYVPLAFYAGKILKCGGIATTGNAEWFKAANPGCIILEGYRGDRIEATTHKPV
jgi:hypothetical protein